MRAPQRLWVVGLLLAMCWLTGPRPAVAEETKSAPAHANVCPICGRMMDENEPYAAKAGATLTRGAMEEPLRSSERCEVSDGRSSGSPITLAPSHPADAGQWLCEGRIRGYSGGSAPELHGLPLADRTSELSDRL